MMDGNAWLVLGLVTLFAVPTSGLMLMYQLEARRFERLYRRGERANAWLCAVNMSVGGFFASIGRIGKTNMDALLDEFDPDDFKASTRASHRREP